eukprot:TRINITY_DN8403_c0_g1_i1.p1 TRINITY_DN8403_c0_g1~~TRINITY_DN8403_c0_g1_i1.p1  ORF type:complete len:381 (+),score=72.68 TRINITY_DN8403_c0_g1_i1:27-1169(+)
MDWEIPSYSKFGHSYSYHILCLTENGEIYGWGKNDTHDYKTNILGKGKTLNDPKNLNDELGLPKELKKNIKAIIGGYDFSMFISKSGEIWSQGNSSYGQTGQGVIGVTSIPKKIMGLEHRVLNVGSGYYHSFCTTYDGEVYTWGKNNYGQLGSGDGKNRHTPTLIANVVLSKNEKIVCGSAGYEFTILLTNLGRVLGSGNNARGQLGEAIKENSNKFVLIKGEVIENTKIIKLCCGNSHVSAITNEGRVITWGNSPSSLIKNRNGISGYYFIDTKSSSRPVEICTGGNQDWIFLENGDIINSGTESFEIKEKINDQLRKIKIHTNKKIKCFLSLFAYYHYIDEDGYLYDNKGKMNCPKIARLMGSSAQILFDWKPEIHKT